MNITYAFLKDQLGKGGFLAAPSTQEEDYETKQLDGTCSSQCLMAFLRHRIMAASVGSASEKEAFYKALKIRLYKHYEVNILPQTDAKTKECATPIIKRTNAEFRFLEIAKNESETKKTLETICDALQKMGVKEGVVVIKQLKLTTQLERYSALRLASKILCSSWLKSHHRIHNEHPIHEHLELAASKFDHKSIARANVTRRLEQYITNKNYSGFIVELYRTASSSPYLEVAFEQALKLFSGQYPVPVSERKKMVVEMVKNMKPYHKRLNLFIENLANSLEIQSHSEMANLIREEWKNQTIPVIPTFR